MHNVHYNVFCKVLPIGATNLDTLESILFSFSKQSRVVGKVASDDEVPKAVANARLIFFKNRNGKVLVMAPKSVGKKIPPCISNPTTNVTKYHPRLKKLSATSFILMISPATKKQTPIGVR